MTPIERLQEQVANLQSKVSGLKADAYKSKTEVSSLQSKVAQDRQDLETDLSGLENYITQSIQDFESEVYKLEAKVTVLEELVEDIKSDLSIIKGVLTGH